MKDPQVLIERDQQKSKVYESKNYDQFKTLLGNRSVNQTHLFQLKQSIARRYLMAPILVNEKMEIIDGQHRFHAARDLGLPVYYFVVTGYGLEEVKILNTHMKNWQKIDYLKAYCDMEHPEYLKFRDFMQKYPMFGMRSCEQLLRNATAASAESNNKELRSEENPKGRYTRRYFQEGELVIDDYELACTNANKIIQVRPYFHKFNHHTFVATMIGMFKKPIYDHDLFLSKLSMNPTMLQPCINIVQYQYVIEDIYNFRNRNKINLRYDK